MLPNEGRSTIVFSPSAMGRSSPLRQSQRLPDSPRKAIMSLGPKSFALCACLCFSSIMAAAQAATCASDAEAPAQGSPIACVTGNGVQVTSNTNAVAAQAAEVLPLTPEQRPASPPVVSYVDGKLTVVAKNSTLGDVLRAIAAKTGASIDVPEAAHERVVSQLGPAPAREVMAALLNGSHFNYVMVGSEANPDSVAHVILTAKTDRPEGSSPASAASLSRPMIQPRTALQAAVLQPYQEMLQQQQAQQAAAVEAQQQIASEIASEPAPQASNEPPASSVAASSGGAEGTPAEVAPAGDPSRNASGTGDKTPLGVLQDLYETRRQMMQVQHQPPPTPQQ